MGATNFPIFIDWKQKVDLSQFTNLEKQVDKFGMRIRLSSRDALRMGSVLDKAATTGISMFEKLLSGSMDWVALNEDIGLAWGDIGAVIGDTITPLLEGIIPILETVAQFLEANPWAIWVALIPLILSLVMKVGAEFFKVYGTGNMIVGMLVTAKKNMLSVGEAAHYMAVWTAQGEEAATAYLISLGKIQDLQVAEQKRDKKGRFAKGKKNVPYKEVKDLGTEVGKTDSKFKKMGSSIATVAGLIGGLGIMSILLSGSNDILNEGMQYLTDMCEPLTEFLGGILGGFMDWADANPAIAQSLVFLGGGLALIIGLGPKVLGFIDQFSFLIGPLVKGIGDVTMKLGAKGLGAAIKTAGIDIKEMGVIPWLSSLLKVSGSKILEYLKGGLGNVAIAAAAVAAGFFVGAYAAKALINWLGPIGAIIVPIIGLMWALVAATAAYYGVLSWGVAVPLILGGIAASVGAVMAATGTLAGLPGMATGGFIKTAGVAMLHPNEVVLPEDKYTMGRKGVESGTSLIQPIRKEEQIPTNITIHINAPIGSKEIADYVTDSVTKSIESKLKRTR